MRLRSQKGLLGEQDPTFDFTFTWRKARTIYTPIRHHLNLLLGSLEYLFTLRPISFISSAALEFPLKASSSPYTGRFCSGLGCFLDGRKVQDVQSILEEEKLENVYVASIFQRRWNLVYLLHSEVVYGVWVEREFRLSIQICVMNRGTEEFICILASSSGTSYFRGPPSSHLKTGQYRCILGILGAILASPPQPRHALLDFSSF